MSHKESIEMPLTEECSARDLNRTRRLRAKASYVLEAFVGVKIRKKERLPRQHKDSQVSNAS